jgi:hypothetical protein
MLAERPCLLRKQKPNRDVDWVFHSDSSIIKIEKPAPTPVCEKTPPKMAKQLHSFGHRHAVSTSR